MMPPRLTALVVLLVILMMVTVAVAVAVVELPRPLMTLLLAVSMMLLMPIVIVTARVDGMRTLRRETKGMRRQTTRRVGSMGYRGEVGRIWYRAQHTRMRPIP
eukprot:Rmarinus@m.23973